MEPVRAWQSGELTSTTIWALVSGQAQARAQAECPSKILAKLAEDDHEHDAIYLCCGDQEGPKTLLARCC